jgi:hypothetical protein
MMISPLASRGLDTYPCAPPGIGFLPDRMTFFSQVHDVLQAALHASMASQRKGPSRRGAIEHLS